QYTKLNRSLQLAVTFPAVVSIGETRRKRIGNLVSSCLAECIGGQKPIIVYTVAARNPITCAQLAEGQPRYCYFHGSFFRKQPSRANGTKISPAVARPESAATVTPGGQVD